MGFSFRFGGFGFRFGFDFLGFRVETPGVYEEYTGMKGAGMKYSIGVTVRNTLSYRRYHVLEESPIVSIVLLLMDLA